MSDTSPSHPDMGVRTQPRVGARPGLFRSMVQMLVRPSTGDAGWRESLYATAKEIHSLGPGARSYWSRLRKVPCVAPSLRPWLKFQHGLSLLESEQWSDGFELVDDAIRTSRSEETICDWQRTTAHSLYFKGRIEDANRYLAAALEHTSVVGNVRFEAIKLRLWRRVEEAFALPPGAPQLRSLLGEARRDAEEIVNDPSAPKETRAYAFRSVGAISKRARDWIGGCGYYAALCGIEGEDTNKDLESWGFLISQAIEQVGTSKGMAVLCQYADIKLAGEQPEPIQLLSWINVIGLGLRAEQRSEASDAIAMFAAFLSDLVDPYSTGRWGTLRRLRLSQDHCVKWNPGVAGPPIRQKAVEVGRAFLAPELLPKEIVAICDGVLTISPKGDRAAIAAAYSEAFARCSDKGDVSAKATVWIAAHAKALGYFDCVSESERRAQRTLAKSELLSSAASPLPDAARNAIAQAIELPLGRESRQRVQDLLDDAHEAVMDQLTDTERLKATVYVASVADSLGCASQAEMYLLGGAKQVNAHEDPVVRARLTVLVCQQMIERGLRLRYKSHFESLARAAKTLAFSSQVVAQGFTVAERGELVTLQHQLQHYLDHPP